MQDDKSEPLQAEEQKAKTRRKPRQASVAQKPDLTENTQTMPDTVVNDKAKPTRTMRPFPAVPFDEALSFTKSLYDFGGGQAVRRLSFFDSIGKMPDSGPSRQLITNANKYNLVKGSYTSEQIDITEIGRKIFDENVSEREKARAKVSLAVETIEPFNTVYQKFVNAKLPARAALIDTMRETGVADDLLEEAVDTLIVNLKAVGLLQNLSGADRFVSIDHLLDGLPSSRGGKITSYKSTDNNTESRSLITNERAGYESTCFYITPIGSDDSDIRKHSNLFLEHIVDPAIKTIGLTVVRADKIDKPGIITRQIIEYILRSRLVIADLSYSNANVYYELALRHAARLPAVQIIKFGEAIPFDVNQMRTIIIDNRDIYSLLPNVELYRSDVATQARRALEDGEDVDTPISVYFPQAKLTF